MKHPRLRTLAAFARNDDGAAAPIIAVCLTLLIGLLALGVDIGHLYAARLRLQAATDAAALAGAQMINQSGGGTAVSTAIKYGPAYGEQNVGIFNASFIVGYPKLICLTSLGIACNAPDAANAIRVYEQADIPTLFAGVFGIHSWHVITTATATSKGGSAAPLDVMIVLDTTASMNTTDSSCTLKNATRLDCAMNGVRTLLSSMPPCAQNLTKCTGASPLVQVGLMVFPGVTSTAQAKFDYDCSSSSPTIAKYSLPPVYEILPLGNDYRVSAAAGLNTSSNIVIAARAGGTGCQQGVSAIGGVGTYYSDAITAAQTALVSEGRTTAQKVIILLSDGDASASSQNISASKLANQCHQAITAAKAATTAGTWVYSIAYGASTSTTGSCSTDTPTRISACSTLQQIASDSSKFFSDTVGGSSSCTSSANSITNLNSIFAAIVTDVTGVRLVSDDTT